MYFFAELGKQHFFKSANPRSVNSWAHSAFANLQIS
jgi:hypothetical protein